MGNFACGFARTSSPDNFSSLSALYSNVGTHVNATKSPKKSPASPPAMVAVMMMVVTMMMPEDNRRQRDAQGKSRSGNHGSRGNGLRRHVILLIHGNGAAFFICVGIIGAVGRGSRHGIVVAGAQRRCDKHPACPSVCMILHGVRRSPVSVRLHSFRRVKITILFVLNGQN